MRRDERVRQSRTAKRTSIALIALVGLMLLPASFSFSPGALAQDSVVTVRLTILGVHTVTNIDSTSQADFYAVVTMDGEELRTNPINNQDLIHPNWQFSVEVDRSRGSIPMVIEIWDADDFLNFQDNLIDITEGPGSSIGLTVELDPCAVTGTVSGECGDVLSSKGPVGGNETASIDFSIEVEEPPSAADLRIRCIHDPIWPQPGDSVTITAESLDGALTPRTADTIEIWLETDATIVHTEHGVANASFTSVPLTGSTFSYGCRVEDDGLVAWTGWRVVTIGPPDDDQAAPVIFTGPRRSRLDIVFIADDRSGNYSSATDPAFLNDVHDVIRDAYYSLDIFLANQDMFNFWVALDTGQAESSDDGCDHQAPRITWADTGAILHIDNFRDCAPGGQRLFSSEPTSLRTVLHETGHRPFGLSDEYCDKRPGSPANVTVCDGGYFETDEAPNLYRNLTRCEADAPNLGYQPSDCQEFKADRFWFFGNNWAVADPPANDLMVDNLTPQAGDIRRIEWMFDNCRNARC